jgi:hypothetical protein
MTTSSVPLHRRLFDAFARWMQSFRKSSASSTTRPSGTYHASSHHYRNIGEQLATSTSGVAPVLPSRESCGVILLYQMLHEAKINAQDIPHDERLALEKGCTACRDKFRCAYELARESAGMTFEEFCNNAASLRALQASKPSVQ